MKTSELTGSALDWAVAKCEGFRVEFNYQYADEKRFEGWWQCGPGHWQPLNKYSSNWAQGGPIIESERIAVWATTDGWKAQRSDTSNLTTAPTPLIAAMRCYVASKLGGEVEIPKGLEQ